jgi:hypothetical protein
VAKRIAEIVILCEDFRQGNFAWHYLKRDGHSYRKLRLQVSPGGQGSGEQYVREQYRKEVGLYRNRSTRRTTALVVMIDADTNTTAYRERQLATQAKRKGAEKIAHLIPKRHIETWILCLTGETVEETTDYKSTKDTDGKIKQAAENFFDWSRDGYSVPARCVASLQNGLKEIRLWIDSK